MIHGTRRRFAGSRTALGGSLLLGGMLFPLLFATGQWDSALFGLLIASASVAGGLALAGIAREVAN